MSEATFTRWVDPTIEEKDKEIERLNNRVRELEKAVSRKEEQITNLDDENFDLENEIERLNSIIKEVREYIEVHKKVKLGNRIKHIQIVLYSLEDVTELLEILDKEK